MNKKMFLKLHQNCLDLIKFVRKSIDKTLFYVIILNPLLSNFVRSNSCVIATLFIVGVACFGIWRFWRERNGIWERRVWKRRREEDNGRQGEFSVGLVTRGCVDCRCMRRLLSSRPWVAWPLPSCPLLFSIFFSFLTLSLSLFPL